MKRSVIIKNILALILCDYSNLSQQSEEYQNIDDDIHDEEWVRVCNALLLLSSTLKFHPLLSKIASFAFDINFVNDEINYGSNKRFCFVDYEKGCYRRCFVYCSNNLLVADTSMFYSDVINDNIWMVLEHACYDSKMYAKVIKDIFTRSKGNTYYIEYNKTIYQHLRNNKQELYSYALASYLKDGGVLDIPAILQFSWSPSVSISFTYNRDVVYKEFFDVYDAINDWLHSHDIITAFIKMYQVIEYMIYRMQMSEIVKRSSIKQSFLRESKNLSKKYADGEHRTIIENIPKLFPGLTLNSVDITAAHDFLDKYFEHTKSGSVYLQAGLSPTELEKNIAKFIYDVRCCIVHNKESEFHILYSNSEEYKEIIPLMKDINLQMVTKVFDVINRVQSEIHYVNSALELY